VRIVLDTNVLVSGVFWGGIPLKILELWSQQKIEVFVTPEILLEYQEILAELGKKEKSDSVEYWLQFVHEYCNLIHPHHKRKICRDPDDDKFINCALSANAIYLVSGDLDLLDLKKVDDIEILKPSGFIRKNFK
jgi:putative PIN family toxin of toxin-antitoxin system